MILTLIGMSGAGKSFLAGKCAAHGFAVIDCDAQIAARLGQLVGPVGSTLEEVGAWMGLPHQGGFAEREAAFRACEQQVLADALDHAEHHRQDGRDCVIDTGGSAIYAEAALLERMRQRTTVIYLHTPDAILPQMLSAYLAQPRPVVWNGAFEQRPGEPLEEAYRRSYASLIAQRQQRYAQLAQITLEYGAYRGAELDAQDLLRVVRAWEADQEVDR